MYSENGTNDTANSSKPVNEKSDAISDKGLLTELSFEIKSIDKYYQPKVIFGANLPVLSLEEMKTLDPECKRVRRILILYTGGTIGMRKHDGAYEPEPNFFCKALLRLPMFNDSRLRSQLDLPNNVFLMPRSPDDVRIMFNVWEYNPLLDSSDVTMDDYIRISKDIQSEYDHYDGFIILHGTDTMSFTGSALSFLLENLTKPVILTGSQIPLFEIRSDGRENLLASLIIASHYDIPEVTLFFHEKLFRANRTSKISSCHFEAFDSPNYPPLAEVGISIKIYGHRIFVPEKNSAPFKVHSDLCPDVNVFRMFPSVTCETVRVILSPPIKGVILLTYGSGNMPFCRKDLLELFREAYDRGCIIINITQCWKGGVKSIYRTGFILREYGIFPGFDMTLEAALNKLSYVLARSDWSIQTKRAAMTRNLRGEITVSDSDSFRDFRTLSQDGIAIDNELMVGAALCTKAKEGNVAMVEQMGKRYGNWEAADYNGRTALHVACAENQTEVVRFLLDKNISINRQDHACFTPLRCAVMGHCSDELVHALKSKGGILAMSNDEIYTEISLAIQRNDLHLFLLFIAAGIDCNLQATCSGNTFLHLSCIYGRLNFVNALLNVPCDPSIQNKNGRTAYDEALERDESDICEILSKVSKSCDL